MSKITTFTTLAALLLSSAYLQIDLASARGRIMLMEPSQNAAAMNEPAQRSAAPASTTTFTPASPQFRPSMENFANTQSGAWGKPAYSIGIDANYKTRINLAGGNVRTPSSGLQTIGDKIKNNVANLGALRDPSKIGGDIPQPQSGMNNGKSKGGKSVPGFDKVGNGPSINLPGSENSKGVTSVPGFENVGNGPSVNLPGGKNGHSVAADMQNFANYLSQNDAANFTVKDPSGNIPQHAGAAETASDGLLDSIISFFGGGETADPKSGESGKNGSKSSGTKPSANGENKSHDKGENQPTGVVRGESWNSTGKDKNGNVIGSSGWANYDVFSGSFRGSSMDVGPITISPGKKMPGDDSTGPVDVNAGLAIGSGFSKRNQGGGSDNNVEPAGASTGELASNTSFAKKDNGDGTNDAGENNLTSSGALADNSSLAKKDQGDGGNSDDRSGGNSASFGAIKINGSPSNGQVSAQATRGR